VAQRDEEGDDGDEDTEPVCGPYPTNIGERTGERVADADPDGGGHRNEGDGRRPPPGREMVTGDAHHEGGLTAAGARRRAADEQPGKGQGKHGERAAGHRKPERGEDGAPAVRTGTQPAEDGRGDSAAEQGDGEGPLRAGERYVECRCDPRDEGCAEAADRGDDEGDEQQ
jgi:hypothetical protein